MIIIWFTSLELNRSVLELDNVYDKRDSLWKRIPLYIIVMRKMLFLLVILNQACGIKNYEHLECGIESVKKSFRILDTVLIREVFDPSALYCVGENFWVVNRKQSGKVFYKYDSELSFHGSYFSYGRAGNEFVFVDNSLKDGCDTALYLYANWFDCTKFSFSERGIAVADNFRILPEIQNNVILLNDSLVFYRALLDDKQFHVYNYLEKEIVCKFGEFPEVPIKIGNDTDRDNVCLCNSVYAASEKKLVVFYESIPIIRLYDMNTHALVREIEIIDCEKQVVSVDDYYADENIIYFLMPMLQGNNIYVQYLNKGAAESVNETVLLKLDLNGNIVEKFVLNQYCPIYTITETGEFCGISILGGEYCFCRTRL